MKVHIELLDDQDQILAEYIADASVPGGWRATAGQRLMAKMPSQSSDNENNGTYEIFGFTYQPHLRVDRPNGWKAPVPGDSPNNGQNQTPQQPPPFGFLPPKFTQRSTSAPAPQQSINKLAANPPATLNRGY